MQPDAVSRDGIAIIGLGCRLPGGIVSLDGLWEALEEERDLVGEVPADRFDIARFVSSRGQRPGKSYIGAGGFLPDVASFDAEYFGISPKEASRMDPQQRLLLECAVEAFDDAGIDPARLAGGDTAVIVGAGTHDYADLQLRQLGAFNAYTAGGMALGNTANRLSYYFDLRGPSSSVDTACASALTAVHLACEALRSGRSPVALAGGAGVLLGPSGFVAFSHASMLSPTGRCRPFSARADGFVRSEGAGVLVLKPLRAALADGDRVHGVIVASGVNNDGRTTGISLPNPRAQAALLRTVYTDAGLAPEDVAYVEAHGTGTQAGDPIECEALGEVLGRACGAEPLPVGSVKSNLGHLEAASGIPGVLKALLVLRERRIPATLHAEPVNDAIDFAGLGLAPVPCARPLDGSERALAAVNSFGFGGANAHVVLAPAPAPGEPAARPPALVPIVVSGRTPVALTEAAARWADQLDAADTAALYDLAFTASRRRAHHAHRIAVLAASPHEAARKLRAVANDKPTAGSASAVATATGRIAFVFNGNGAQWPGMGARMLEEDPAFRAEVAAIDGVLSAELGWSVLQELAAPADPRRCELTEVAQPLLFAVQAGLVAALEARGVRPAAVCGHSVGEVAAAYCAGALDREAACSVIAARSRAQAATAGAGRMAAVGADAADVRRRITEAGFADCLTISAFNGSCDVTVAGDAAALAALGATLEAGGVFFRDLELDYAFHSPVMDPLRGELIGALADLNARCAEVPFVSTVTGDVVPNGGLAAEYWWSNVREPVQFNDAVRTVTGSQGCDVLVEIGPHPVLRTYLRRNAADQQRKVAVIATLTRTAAGCDALESTRAQVIAAGAFAGWDSFFPVPGRVVTAPPYPWQRERHWNGAVQWWLEESVDEQPIDDRSHPLLGPRQADPEPTWRQRIEPDQTTWLADHRVGEAVVLPAAAYVDMALAAGQEALDAPAEITRLSIDRALTLTPDDPDAAVTLHSSLAADGTFAVASRSGAGSPWVRHARGRVRRLLADRPAALDLTAIRARMSHLLTADEHYARCAVIDLPYGPAFRTLTELHSGNGEVLAAYRATIDLGDAHPAHPSVLDGALQAGLPLVAALGDDPMTFLPSGFDRVRCWARVPTAGFVHVRAQAIGHREACWDLTITDPDGVVALEVIGGQLRRFDAGGRPAPTWLTEVLRAAPLPGEAHAAAPLQPPAAVLAGCSAELQRLGRRCYPRPYSDYRRRTLEMASHFTGAALRDLLPGRRTFGLDDLFAAGVAVKRAPELGVLMRTACEHGVLRPEGPGRWHIAIEPEPDRLAQASLEEFPGESASTLAFVVCGRHLAAVLRGDIDPLELLFSEIDSIAGRFYDATPISHFRNGAAQLLLRGALTGWPTGKPLRVLELGAGTGGTTAELLPEFDPQRTRYTYTDLSPAFFAAAEARFAAYDFLDYRRLDLDSDPARQGFTPGSFDLVIAANVLHATKDLTQSLRRVADLLVDGGQLLALECHSNKTLAPIFGLLDSFWLATDTDLRPDGPLLPRDGWPPLLDACGFGAIAQTGDDVDPSAGDCSVILAARDARARGIGRYAPAAEPVTGDRRYVIVDLQEESSAHGLEIVAALRARVGVDAVTRASLGSDPAAWVALLASTPGPLDVVLVAGDEPSGSPSEITARSVRYCAVLRALALAHARDAERSDVALWLVLASNGTGAGTSCPPTAAGAGAVAWGAARTFGNEQPRVAVRRIELARDGSDDEERILADRLCREMLERPEDDEVLLTLGGRFVTRVKPATPSTPYSVPAGDEHAPYVLALDSPGLHYRLRWQATTVPVPGRGEVVVRIAAAALNYRDIMIATGLVPFRVNQDGLDATDLGFECAGTVLAVGSDVRDVAVGDRVASYTRTGAFTSHTLMAADVILPIPDHMTFEEAATMPAVFTTVRHTLHHLARLAEGETVLVHGGAGGVGLATLQHARNVGARVIATAGSPAKRDLLSVLGVAHVLNSRSLHFADEIMALTGGEGVDIVLNSLAGEAMVRSLDVLRPGGRFVELGKRDFLADNPLPLAAFARNISFFGVDVSPSSDDGSSIVDAHVTAIRQAMLTGEYRPLPYRAVPAARIRDAFACLHHSRHVGKVVVTFDEPVRVPPPATPTTLDAAATYLITGGLSGLGAATARHLADRGARHLTLIGRRGRRTPGADALLADLEARGVTVDAQAADASDLATMRAIFKRAAAGGRRVAGVIHAALVLSDDPLTQLTDERVRAVIAPKTTAGHIIDELTRDSPLDFFVVYSSISALAGHTQQSSYAAANVGLEALVRGRQRAGLRSLALQWGAIADTGFVHRSGRAGEMARIGLGDLTTREALAAFDELLERADAVVVSVSAGLDWKMLHALDPTLSKPRSVALLPSREQAETSGQLRAALKTASPQDAANLVEDALAELLAGVLQTSTDRVHRDRPIAELGVDSLMGAEFAAAVHDHFNCEIPIFEVVGAPHIVALTQRVLARLHPADTRPPDDHLQPLDAASAAPVPSVSVAPVSVAS
jgi:acyl transferase domain-containing protein/NADPH:quinone reductase-like Zn-dependent oxidoreductase/SAM-dependent methyltransferase/acyl carrier protein